MGERPKRVKLLGTIRVIHEHLTTALCDTVFDELRTGERRRVWTLEVMAQFWVAVILRAPDSLRQALDECVEGSGGFPRARSSPQAFFERAGKLRFEFFRELYEGFLESALRGQKPVFEASLRRSLPAFPEIWVVDGSRLDQIAHRLKVLWKSDVAVLPGSILALYDLYRGVARKVEFSPDAAAAEVPALKAALDGVPEGALLVADGAYCSHKLFGHLAKKKLSALVRCTDAISVETVKVLGRQDQDGWIVEDAVVVVGTPQRPDERRTVRMITRRRKGKKTLRLLTTVLDPEALAPKAALALYGRRWSVERLFYDLKEVIDLHSFYAGNANAVAMQVYAAALVHGAMRIAQAKIAGQLRLIPEELSVEKLFPRVAAAASAYVTSQRAFIKIQEVNPGVKLVEPDWNDADFASVLVESILVEQRSPKRRRLRPRASARCSYASLHRFTRASLT